LVTPFMHKEKKWGSFDLSKGRWESQQKLGAFFPHHICHACIPMPAAAVPRDLQAVAEGQSCRPNVTGYSWPRKAEKQSSSSVLVFEEELPVVVLALLTAPGASPSIAWGPCMASP